MYLFFHTDWKSAFISAVSIILLIFTILFYGSFKNFILICSFKKINRHDFLFLNIKEKTSVFSYLNMAFCLLFSLKIKFFSLFSVSMFLNQNHKILQIPVASIGWLMYNYPVKIWAQSPKKWRTDFICSMQWSKLWRQIPAPSSSP